MPKKPAPKKSAKKNQEKEKEPCTCGHVELEHKKDGGACRYNDNDEDKCDCTKFEEEES